MVAFLPAFFGLADGLAGIGTVGSFPPPCIVLTTHSHKLSTTEEAPTPLTEICRIHEKQPGSFCFLLFVSYTCGTCSKGQFSGTSLVPSILRTTWNLQEENAKGQRRLACPDS